MIAEVTYTENLIFNQGKTLGKIYGFWDPLLAILRFSSNPFFNLEFLQCLLDLWELSDFS